MTTAASELHFMHAVREMQSESRCDHHSRSLKYVHEKLRFHDRKCGMVTLLRHSLESGQKWHESGVLTSLPKVATSRFSDDHGIWNGCGRGHESREAEPKAG